MTAPETTPQDAGRALDALIYTAVFGSEHSRHASLEEVFAHIPHYSTDIAAAWLVVEEMDRRGWKVDVQNRYRPTWACHVHFASPDNRSVYVHTWYAPLAICLAALEAVGALPLDSNRVPRAALRTQEGA